MREEFAQLRSTEWRQSEEFVPLAPRKIIGVNNLMSIAWLSRGLQLAGAVGRVLTLGGPGTGFLIGPDLLMTNHHVIPDEAVAENATVEFNYQENWKGTMEPSYRYTLDASFFRTSKELDYTIVRVKESPGDRFGYIDPADHGTPVVNDYVSVIQHPRAGPKQICLTDNKVSAVFGDVVQYATDTEPGSSGSPVFNQQWNLVGLHHKGGGLAGPDGDEHFTNQGILISSILRDAASFLGVPDPLYTLAFGVIRAPLVHLIATTRSASDLAIAEQELLRNHPQVSRKLGDWANLNCGRDGSRNACLCRGGIAIGAALRQWARHDGHEAIPRAAMNEPEPPSELYDLVGRLKAKDLLPADLCAEVDSALRDGNIAARVLRVVGNSIASPEQAFLLGVGIGAAAMEGPPGSRDVTRAGR